MAYTTEITTPQGITFTVRLLEAGDRYGLDGCFTADRETVEFYDARYTERKQLVARYWLSTLMDDAGILMANGLDLHGEIEPDWKIDGPNMARVLQWAMEGLGYGGLERCPTCGHTEPSDGYGGNDCPECSERMEVTT